jgi:sugar-specific transcriptional regulator TrmB
MEVDKMSLERILKALIDLGLSQTEAEIYVHLATAGPATAKSITSNLTFNKRQIYRSLRALQQKGIASGNDEYPAEFYAVSFEQALDLLLEVKKEQAKSLEASKAELISDFQTEKRKVKDSN